MKGRSLEAGQAMKRLFIKRCLQGGPSKAAAMQVGAWVFQGGWAGPDPSWGSGGSLEKVGEKAGWGERPSSQGAGSTGRLGRVWCGPQQPEGQTDRVLTLPLRPLLSNLTICGVLPLHCVIAAAP